MHNDEFKHRRQQVMKWMDQDSIAIIASAPEYIRTGDTHFTYRQNSNFYYLTGFSEPNAIAILAPGYDKGEYILFNQKSDPDYERWVGPVAGQEGACRDFGVDQAFDIKNADNIIPNLIQNYKKLYCNLGTFEKFDHKILAWLKQIKAKVRTGINAPVELIALEGIVHEMRLFKSAAEIAVMRQAAEISAHAHQQTMRICRPGLMEYQLEAELVYEFMRHGCRTYAYPTIVASGKNACVLHYINNNKQLNNGDLVLIDAGGELNNYASDITRTFPVNGRFSAEQKAIYELVLAAQLAGLKEIYPGNRWDKIQQTIVTLLTEGLIELGILKGKVDNLIESCAYSRFYMHHFGHWLGLDTHDVGSYKPNGEWRALQPGMVLTMEPGLYITSEHADIDPRWHNIGVRIEDDVLVTEHGHEVLSKDAPKHIDDVEALMRS